MEKIDQVRAALIFFPLSSHLLVNFEEQQTSNENEFIRSFFNRIT